MSGPNELTNLVLTVTNSASGEVTVEWSTWSRVSYSEVYIRTEADGSGPEWMAVVPNNRLSTRIDPGALGVRSGTLFVDVKSQTYGSSSTDAEHIKIEGECSGSIHLQADVGVGVETVAPPALSVDNFDDHRLSTESSGTDDIKEQGVDGPDAVPTDCAVSGNVDNDVVESSASVPAEQQESSSSNGPIATASVAWSGTDVGDLATNVGSTLTDEDTNGCSDAQPLNQVAISENVAAVECLNTSTGLDNILPAPAEPPNNLTVSTTLDPTRSNLTATVWWNRSGELADRWQITVKNMTWRLNGEWYKEWIFYVNDRPSSTTATDFHIPLRFQSGNRYHVTVRGLKRMRGRKRRLQHEDDEQSAPESATSADLDEFYVVVSKGVREFRAGDVLSMSDMYKLLETAKSYIRKDSNSVVCKQAMRNKAASYFDRLLKDDGGVMRAYTKDATGDPRSPINGEIDGLFFMCGLRRGKSADRSPYGDRRLWVDVEALLDRASNVYFADFYCMNGGRDHYVTLVLTKSGTEADRLCSSRLPRISLCYDPSPGRIIYREQNQIWLSDAVFVEAFFADDLNVQELIDAGKARFEYNVRLFGSGKTTQGGRSKSDGCPVCDICSSSSRSTSLPSGYELF